MSYENGPKSTDFIPAELPDRHLLKRSRAAATRVKLENFDSPSERYFRNRRRVIKYGETISEFLKTGFKPAEPRKMRDCGWTGERRAARSSDVLVGGSHAHNYGKFVSQMFKNKPDAQQVADHFAKDAMANAAVEDQLYTLTSDQELTPKHVLHMEKLDHMDNQDSSEQNYDSGSYNGSTNANGTDKIYDDHYIQALLNPVKKEKPPLVYQTKSSAEYMNVYCSHGGGSVRSDTPRHQFDYKVQQERDVKTSYAVGSRDTLRGSSSAADNPHSSSTVLVDYSRLPKTDRRMGTNYNFRDTSFLRRTDSRIVGSDFVVVSMHKDPWYDKVDQLLADARDIKRF